MAQVAQHLPAIHQVHHDIKQNERRLEFACAVTGCLRRTSRDDLILRADGVTLRQVQPIAVVVDDQDNRLRRSRQQQRYGKTAGGGIGDDEAGSVKSGLLLNRCQRGQVLLGDGILHSRIAASHFNSNLTRTPAGTQEDGCAAGKRNGNREDCQQNGAQRHGRKRQIDQVRRDINLHRHAGLAGEGIDQAAHIFQSLAKCDAWLRHHSVQPA